MLRALTLTAYLHTYFILYPDNRADFALRTDVFCSPICQEHRLWVSFTLSLSLSLFTDHGRLNLPWAVNFSLSPEHVKLKLLWAIKIFFLLFSYPASRSLYFCSTDYLTLSFASVLLAWTEPYRRANTASCEANTHKHAAIHTWNFSWWLFTIFPHHVRLPELNSEFCFLFSDHRLPIFLDTDDLSPHSLYSIWNFYWNHGLSGSAVFFSMNAIPNPYAHGFRLDNCTADCDVTVALHIHSHEVFKYLLIQWPSPLYVQLVTPENSSSSNSSSSSFSGDFEVIDDSEFDLNIDTLWWIVHWLLVLYQSLFLCLILSSLRFDVLFW